MSVYLGLVLVGGTAPVLAHSALTRHFDIKNEIVFEDDLDKKPDEEIKNLAESIENYFDELENFIQDLQKLRRIEKFDLDYDKFKISEISFVPCNIEGDPIRSIFSTNAENKIGNRWLEPALTDAKYSFEGWNNISDCLEDEKYKTGISKSSDFKLSYDKTTLELKISFFKSSIQKAEQLAGNFNRAFELYELDEDEIIIKEIHENTSFKSENNQVFIVTRLPRGSIDALLAEKDAR